MQCNAMRNAMHAGWLAGWLRACVRGWTENQIATATRHRLQAAGCRVRGAGWTPASQPKQNPLAD